MTQPDNADTQSITITRLDTPEKRQEAAERIAGMTREEAFRCAWDDCEAAGTIYLGSRRELLFCDACAARPQLNRFKVRKLRSEVEWWNNGNT